MDLSISPVNSPLSINSINTTSSSRKDAAAATSKPKLYWTFLISGLLISIPWGVISNSINVFEEHLKGTSYGEAFMSHFAVVFLATKLTFMFVAFYRGGSSPRTQCLLGALGILAVMSSFFLLVLLAGYFQPFTFYIVVMAASMAASLSSGVLETGVYVMAGQAQSINAVLIGQSTSALFSSFITLLFLATLSSFKASDGFALGNFSIAILISLLVIILLARSSLGTQNNNLKNANTNNHDQKEVKTSVVLKKCSIECTSLFFGSLLSSIVGVFLISKTWSVSSSATFRPLFRPIAYLLLALADLLSKLLPQKDNYRFLNLPILPITIGRTLLIPLFLFGNIRASDGRATALPTFLANDVLFYACVMGFSFIGGYVASIASIQATMKVVESERGRASFLVGASGLAGALLGSLLSASISAFLF